MYDSYEKCINAYKLKSLPTVGLTGISSSNTFDILATVYHLPSVNVNLDKFKC